jgi:uncharacterized coiled-coil protein SlyX
MDSLEATRRITELEARYMELERYAEGLSSVVEAHERKIQQLVELVQLLVARQDEGTEQPRQGQNERPPHY